MTSSFEEYNDEFQRALATSRIALSPVIGDMQQTRRDLRQLDIPDCAVSARDSLVASMDETINEFLAFEGNEADSIVQAHARRATDLTVEYRQKLTELGSVLEGH